MDDNDKRELREEMNAAFREGLDAAKYRSRGDAILQTTLKAGALAVAIASPVAWYWRIAIFFGLMFLLGIIIPALKGRPGAVDITKPRWIPRFLMPLFDAITPAGLRLMRNLSVVMIAAAVAAEITEERWGREGALSLSELFRDGDDDVHNSRRATIARHDLPRAWQRVLTDTKDFCDRLAPALAAMEQGQDCVCAMRAGPEAVRVATDDVRQAGNAIANFLRLTRGPKMRYFFNAPDQGITPEGYDMVDARLRKIFRYIGLTAIDDAGNRIASDEQIAAVLE